MADLEYFIVCRSVAADIDTDELTFANVLEDFYPEEFPAEIPKLVAVSAWRISDVEKGGDFQTMLRVLIPGKNEQEAVEFPMNLARGRTRHRAMQTILETPLNMPGELRFEVKLNGKHAASHTITIHSAPTGKVRDESVREQCG